MGVDMQDEKKNVEMEESQSTEKTSGDVSQAEEPGKDILANSNIEIVEEGEAKDKVRKIRRRARRRAQKRLR